MPVLLIRAEVPESLSPQCHGKASLFFSAADSGKVLVKVMDDRRIESLKNVDLD